MSNSTVINKVLSTGFVVGVVASSFSGLNTEASIMNSYTSLLETGFRDVPLDSPFSRNIISLREANVISGFPDSTFRPAQRVTRAEMSKFIFNGFEIEQNLSCAPFPDVNSSNGFFRFVTSLRCNNIIAGFPDGLYRPDNSVTRGEMAKFIVNAAGFKVNTSAGFFPDAPTGNTFASEISTLKCLGVVRGFEDGTYKPGNTVTRGEMAAFIDRARNVDPSTTECVADGELVDEMGSVTFVVRDSADKLITNPTITVRDSEGNIVTDLTNLPNGQYTYRVENAGELATGTFTINGNNVNVNVELQAIVPFEIKVTNETGGVIAGATVVIDGQSYTTDANGLVEVDLIDGQTYNLVVTKDNFVQSDNFTVKPVTDTTESALVVMRDRALIQNKVMFNVTDNFGLPVSLPVTITGQPAQTTNTEFQLPNGNYTYSFDTQTGIFAGTPLPTNTNLSVTGDTTVEFKLSRVKFIFKDQSGNVIPFASVTSPMLGTEMLTMDEIGLVPAGSYKFTTTQATPYAAVDTTVTIQGGMNEVVTIVINDTTGAAATTAGYTFPLTNAGQTAKLLGDVCTIATMTRNGVAVATPFPTALDAGTYVVTYNNCTPTPATPSTPAINYANGSVTFTITAADFGKTKVVPVTLQEANMVNFTDSTNAALADGAYFVVKPGGSQIAIVGGSAELDAGTYTLHAITGTGSQPIGIFTVAADGSLSTTSSALTVNAATKTVKLN